MNMKKMEQVRNLKMSMVLREREVLIKRTRSSFLRCRSDQVKVCDIFWVLRRGKVSKKNFFLRLSMGGRG